MASPEMDLLLQGEPAELKGRSIRNAAMQATQGGMGGPVPMAPPPPPDMGGGPPMGGPPMGGPPTEMPPGPPMEMPPGPPMGGPPMGGPPMGGQGGAPIIDGALQAEIEKTRALIDAAEASGDPQMMKAAEARIVDLIGVLLGKVPSANQANQANPAGLGPAPAPQMLPA